MKFKLQIWKELIFKLKFKKKVFYSFCSFKFNGIIITIFLITYNFSNVNTYKMLVYHIKNVCYPCVLVLLVNILCVGIIYLYTFLNLKETIYIKVIIK